MDFITWMMVWSSVACLFLRLNKIIDLLQSNLESQEVIQVLIAEFSLKKVKEKV